MLQTPGANQRKSVFDPNWKTANSIIDPPSYSRRRDVATLLNLVQSESFLHWLATLLANRLRSLLAVATTTSSSFLVAPKKGWA